MMYYKDKNMTFGNSLYFKLSFKNMKKSFKDYTIYFLTLVLGIAIFYMFNSIDSQQAMIKVSESTREIIKLMIQILNYISVFVAIVLGLLIVYASKFLINRRKKEFGIYMTLGMGRRQISRIILLETIFVGIISLVIGLVVGIFSSQFMSILVAKMFEADMSEFQFVFSKQACVKTCIFFAVMYLAVMIFNAFTVSRYKLINLINANKKNEKVKIKNTFLAILIFIFGIGILSYAYWKVTTDISSLTEAKMLLKPILMGVVGTVAIFWSLSGFILRVVQSMKRIYLKDTNMFILRQINNKINTTVISMSIICLMLFLTISILSTALGIRDTMKKELEETTPVDINLYKEANLPETYTDRKGKEIAYNPEVIKDSRKTITQTLQENEADMSVLKDTIEIPIYATNKLTLKDFLGNRFEEFNNKYPFLIYSRLEDIVKVSDYNKLAKLYGLEQQDLKDNEYAVMCDFNNSVNMRNVVLQDRGKLQITGKEYLPKYNECKDGFVMMVGSHSNTGIIVVPDSCNLTEDMIKQYLLAANYNAITEEEKAEVEKQFIYSETEENSKLINNLSKKGIKIDGTSKISIIESSVGVTTIITFIAIYLGIIFLIASSAILALKQLTESSDNKQRYTILRKIGCDEKMINKSLFRQIGIFFVVPLILAIIHSIFGIKFALAVMSELVSANELLPSIIVSAIVIGFIYGAYFFATYFGSKKIIKEES